MTMDHLIWAVPLLPLLGACLNGFLVARAPQAVQRNVAGWLATLASAAAFVAVAAVAAGLPGLLGSEKYRDVLLASWIEVGSLNVPLALRIDALSITMGLVVTGVGTLIHIFSVGYMRDDPRVTRYFAYLNLFMFAMLILVFANNYLLMFVGWEGVGLCSFLLIGFWFERHSAAQAGKKAFIINRVGDFGFLLAMFAIFWLTGTLTFNDATGTGVLDQADKLVSPAQLLGWPAVVVIAALLFLAATGKSAQLPLYLWLPDAMEGPTPVSALIHAATMVTSGVYLVARSAPLFDRAPEVQALVAWIGVITALYAAIAAVRQYDIKRVLAYSTVSQLGYMFVGVGVGAYFTGIFHVVTHAFFKALLFLGAGAVMHSLEGQLDMRKMGNLKKHMPITFATFAVGWYAIAGLPFGAGFFSKDAILEQALGFNTAIFVIGVLVAGLTAFYMTRLFVTVFLGDERIEMGDEGHHAEEGGHAHGHGAAHGSGHGHGHAPHVHPEQWVMNGPLVVLAILSLVGGLAFVNVLPKALEPVTSGLNPPGQAQRVEPRGSHSPDDGHGHAPGEVHSPDDGHGHAPGEVHSPDDGHGHAPGETHGAPAAAGTHAEGGHGGHHEWSLASLTHPATIASTIAAILGVLLAWVAFGPNRFAQGWPPAVERALSAPLTLYEGALHLIFVRGGDALAQLLYRVVDRGLIDRAVDGVGDLVNFLAENLRTLQTGYVRNYALVMLAGAVFVVVCFMLILAPR